MIIRAGTTTITPLPTTPANGVRWLPTVGPEAQGVIERKRLAKEGGRVLDAATSILAHGVSPAHLRAHSVLMEQFWHSGCGTSSFP